MCVSRGRPHWLFWAVWGVGRVGDGRFLCAGESTWLPGRAGQSGLLAHTSRTEGVRGRGTRPARMLPVRGMGVPLGCPRGLPICPSPVMAALQLRAARYPGDPSPHGVAANLVACCWGLLVCGNNRGLSPGTPAALASGPGAGGGATSAELGEAWGRPSRPCPLSQPTHCEHDILSSPRVRYLQKQ